MTDEPTPPKDDAERDPLLDFTPVPRKCVRRNGWTPKNQREFIRMIRETGNPNVAADAVGLTSRGAYDLRKTAGSEPFFAAWDAALAAYRQGRRGRANLPPKPAAMAATDAPDAPDEDEDRRIADEIFELYRLKIVSERRARLQGRIVAADFYIRQATTMEIILETEGRAFDLITQWKRGGVGLHGVVATPIAVLLDEIRREAWREAGEPERPPLPILGRHDGEVATGVPDHYSREQDGPDVMAWFARQEQGEAAAAEAQRAWEKKARRDARRWSAYAARPDGDDGKSGAPAPEARR